MIRSPFVHEPLLWIGPVPVAAAVVVTWGIMLALALGCWAVSRRLSLRPGRWQMLLELYVTLLNSEIRGTLRTDPAPYLPLIGTLFLYILIANWSSLIPGLEPPTARLETDIALAMIVLAASAYFGIRAQGLGGYLKTFAHPSIFMLPINLIESITRTLSLTLRLFGNIVSGVFVVGILLSIAGLLVPIPLMALDLLTGAVQAYIFATLALVFIASTITPDIPDPKSTAKGESP